MIVDDASAASSGDVLARTRAWLERVVIGLNLCPFAKAVHVRGRIRHALSDATDEETLLADLETELRRLHGSDESVVETTLLLHPGVLGDFLDYNQFLDRADALLERLGLDDTFQVASFKVFPGRCSAASHEWWLASYKDLAPGLGAARA